MPKFLILTTFFVTLVVSMIIHVPASWVVAELKAQQLLPPQVQLKQVDGIWWDGTAQVSFSSSPGAPLNQLGLMDWQLQFSSLLTGWLESKINWRIEKSEVGATLKMDANSLIMDSISGSLPVGALGNMIPQAAMLQGAEGRLNLRNLTVEIPLDQRTPWPKKLSGQAAITDLSVLGMEADTVELTPALNKGQLILSIAGGGKSWQLSGEVALMKNHKYKIQLMLTADTAESMPEWVSVMMRRTSSTKAEFKQQGRW